MSFKIVSTVSVYEYPPEGSDAEGVNHIVLSRKRLLHPGEKISVSGSITYDVETKGDWINAKGEIKIIDGNTVEIRWRPSLSETVFHATLGPERSVPSRILEAREYAKWDEERRVQMKEGPTPVELENTYNSEPVIPEVFTLVDKARIGHLTEKMLRRVEGTKRVDRKTRLIYDP